MSSSRSAKENPPSPQTRRATTRTENGNGTGRRNGNNRSLSGKFRGLFRKSSPSPNRKSLRVDSPPPSAPARQQSRSPDFMSAAKEAPHLRAPRINWPFSKKKGTSPSPTRTSKSKPDKKNSKDNLKSKKPTQQQIEISGPLIQEEYRTFTDGQNTVPRTPETARSGTGRTHSLSTYETTTKGFRDYMIIDNSKPSQRVTLPNTDMITQPPSYSTNRSHSPTAHRDRLPNTVDERYFHHNVSSTPPASDNEVFPTPPSRRKTTHTSSVSSVRALVEENPLLPTETMQTPRSTVNSNPWKNTSISSLNNTETHLTTSSSVDVDVPKFQAPYVSYDRAPNIDKSKQTNSLSYIDDTTNSFSTLSHTVHPSRVPTSAHDSLADIETYRGGSYYPGLSAIVYYHMHPDSVYLNDPPLTTSSQRTKRFDASTTTLNEYDQEPIWPGRYTNASPTPTSFQHQHDGYIRPLTPQKSPLHSDFGAIHVDVDNPYGQSTSTSYRAPHYNASEPAVVYRSSTTIFTKDKNNYADGSEVRTWSSRDHDDMNAKHKTPTSIHVEHIPDDHDALISKIINACPYHTAYYEPEIVHTGPQEQNYEVVYQYETNNQNKYAYDQRQFDTERYTQTFNNDKTSQFVQSSSTNERDNIYDSSSRPYQYTEYKQEPMNTVSSVRNSETPIRHFALKRTDSYDGLGVFISADAKTGRNPRIRDVEVGSPGYRAGLRKDDRILSINGTDVENLEFSDVLLLIKQGLNNNNLQFSVINESILL